ncbi:transcription factor [Fusarium beomiforme]|uniref:Transcription factor n=1 Tax=Fusarium beomiforme TaxID=44412 RepID=A0A9P5DZR6_9HYPO|nr:transcription factor [Fusarium beomiforme]
MDEFILIFKSVRTEVYIPELPLAWSRTLDPYQASFIVKFTDSDWCLHDGSKIERFAGVEPRLRGKNAGKAKKFTASVLKYALLSSDRLGISSPKHAASTPDSALRTLVTGTCVHLPASRCSNHKIKASSAFSPTFPDPMPSPMDTEDSPRIPRSSKRRRLNFACNYCRGRKTRCDEQQPSCQACILAGVTCVTEDRRRPGKVIKRREAGKSTDGGSVTSASPSEYGLQGQAAGDGTVERRQSVAGPRTISEVTGPIRARSQSPRPSQSRDSSHTDTISNPLPIWRQSTGTTSFQVLTEWLDLACFRLGIPYHFGSYPPSSLNPQSASQPHGIPITPETWVPQTLFDAYSREIHTFFPVVRLDQARADVVQSHLSSRSGDIAALRSHLLFAAGGWILQHADRKSYMDETLSLARNALGHLIGNVSYETVEVLFLFSVCLRLNDELISAWTTLGICLSIAHSLGLNKPGKQHKKPVDIDAWSPAWWALYSYEKLFSFQLGYVSTISDDAFETLDLDVLKSATLQPPRIALSMASVFSKMTRRCATARQLEERASRKAVEAVIKEKVNSAGEAFLMLTNWANSVPAGIRPTSDFMRVPEDLALASFVSLHYHNALIMLNRNSLLISKNALHKAVEIIAKGTPWEYQIRNGQSMVANSARKIIHLLADSEDSASHLFAPAYFPLLHAMYVLAVHILKQPHSRISKIDQSLLVTAADLVRCYCVRLNEEDRLNTILNGLLRVVQEAMKPVTATGDSERDTPALNSSTNLSDQNVTPLTEQHSEIQTFTQSLRHSDSAFLGPPPLAMEEGILDPFSGQPFNMPIMPDEIGCDWADFENLLQRLESEGNMYPVDEGMIVDI